ncbi:g4849 [Coccomyxa elongata]
MWAMLELNPHTFDALDIISIDSPSMPQNPATDTRDWHAILAGIQLSQEQEDQMLACRRTALQGFGALVAERESVWAQLQSIEDVEEQSGFATTRFTETTRLLEELCANMNGMHTCCCFYLTNIYGKLLTPVQVARYLVSCLPRGPDTIELVTVLAKQRNEPSNEELLRAACPGTAGAGAETNTCGFSTSNNCVWRVHDWGQDFTQPLRMLMKWQGAEFI